MDNARGLYENESAMILPFPFRSVYRKQVSMFALHENCDLILAQPF